MATKNGFVSLNGLGGLDVTGTRNAGVNWARVTMVGTGGLVATGGATRAGVVSIAGTGGIKTNGHRLKTSVSANLLQDVKEYRSEAPVSAEWGNGTQYTRVFNIPLTDYSTAIAGDLALGATMQQAWMTAGQYTNYQINGPKVQSVQRRLQKGGGQDQVIVTFLAVTLPAAVTFGYNESLRTSIKNKRQLDDVTVIWGIAKNESSDNIPEEGDQLTAGAITPTTAICQNVEILEGRQHGRVLVRSIWSAGRNDVTLNGPGD